MSNKNFHASSYQGFETAYNSLRMRIKMIATIFLWLAILHAVLVVVFMRVFLSGTEFYTIFCWLTAWFLNHVVPTFEMGYEFQGQQYLLPARDLYVYLTPYVGGYWKKAFLVIAWSSSVYLAGPLLLRIFKAKSKAQSEQKFIRGAQLTTPEKLKKEMRMNKEKPDIPLGQIKLPRVAEVKHIFTVGRPGVGKTVMQTQVIERLKTRGEKGIVYDFKGDLVAKFFDPQKDFIFNPLDSRSLGWNLFNDIHTFMDVDAVAASLIPSPYQSDPFWNDAARDVFAGSLHHLFQTGKRTNQDIWDFVKSDIALIAKRLKKTKGGERGYVYIQDASSKQAMSVMAVLMQYVKSFEFMGGVEGDFSIAEWLESGEGFIFVTNYADVQDTLKPILSLFVDFLGRKLLSLPDSRQRRLFVLMDEFGTLQRLPTIVKILTLSRSKGGSVWIGVQDIGQVDKIYTKDLRQAIVNACGNSIMFSVADPDTAKFLSEKIGETEYLDTEQTHSMGVSDNRDGVSLMQRKKTEKLILPSEIMELKDLHSFVKMANYHLTKSRFHFKSYPDRQPPFEIRADLILDNIVAEQESIDAQAAALVGGNEKGLEEAPFAVAQADPRKGPPKRKEPWKEDLESAKKREKEEVQGALDFGREDDFGSL